MQDKIKDKLVKYLRKHNHLLDQEDGVVYFLVEIRKFLDRQRDLNREPLFSILRFYCDWIVHTNKKTITKQILDIMNKIDAFFPLNPREQAEFSETIPFVYFGELRKELKSFFQIFHFPDNLVKDNEYWFSFAKTLVKVLIDQPILNPTPNILSFNFKYQYKHMVIYLIEFRDQRGRMKFATFMAKHKLKRLRKTFTNRRSDLKK